MKKLWLILGVVLFDVIVLALVFNKTLRISFHRLARNAALEDMHRSASSHQDFEKYTQNMKFHEDALIRLGYFERRKFDLKYIKVPSPQAERIFSEYRTIYPRASYAVGTGTTPSILDEPAKMPVWEALFRKYDVPPSDSNNIAVSGNNVSSVN